MDTAPLTLALTCGDCREPAAVVTIPHPPALKVPDVLEFAVKAIVKFCSGHAPSVGVLWTSAQRGEWPAVIAELSAVAQDAGMLVLCETCRRREGTGRREVAARRIAGYST